MTHLPRAPTLPNVRLPSWAVAVWSKLLTAAAGSSRRAFAPRRQCFTGPVPGAFFGARVTRQPQTTNANRTARKIPSSRLSAMLFSASGRGASIRGAGTPFPLDRQRGHHCCGSQCRGTMGAIAVSPSRFGELTKGRCRSQPRKDWIASLSLLSGRPLRAEPVGSQ
jgi:hypothetical protein